MIKVSVIVPVYNVYDYLEKCLDSLVKQTLKEIEVIIVNDGSIDNSQLIIDKYTKKYKNMISYIKDNGGLSDARNYGIKRAHGDYLSFIDSDDYIDESMLEKMYNYAVQNNLDIVTCDSIKVYLNGNKQELLKSNLNYSSDDKKNYLLSHPMACTRIYKREIFNFASFKKGIYYEDLELIPKLLNITTKVGFIDEGLYYYLQRNGSIMYQHVFNDKLLDIFSVLESNKEVLYDKYPQEIEYMYITHLLRTASLRFLEYNNKDIYLDKICNIMKEEFPNWSKNIYFKKSSIKLKLICVLAYFKKRKILKLIKKIFKI